MEAAPNQRQCRPRSEELTARQLNPSDERKVTTMSNQALSPIPRTPISRARIVGAAALDLLTVFFLAGLAIGYLTGNLTEKGFELQGAPALGLFAVMAAYFVIFTRHLGGTPWQRLLGVR